MNIERFYPEDTAVVNAETLTLAGIYFDPTTVKVTVLSPSGSVVVDNQDMVNDDTGKYHYDYDIPADAETGIYTSKVQASSGARVKNEKDNFEVVEL